MKYKNNGKEFEILVHKILQVLTKDFPTATVSHNDKITGPDGLRQVDVMLRHEIGGIDFTTIVECKDYRSPVNVKCVDELHSKLQDLKASKGIIISRKGFSKTARQKADRLGIELLTVDHASNIDTSRIRAIPLLVCHIRLINVSKAFRIGKEVPKALQVSADMNVNGIPARDIFIEAYRRNLVFDISKYPGLAQIYKDRGLIVDVKKLLGDQALYVNASENEKILVPEIYLVFDISASWHLGEVRDIKSAAQIIDERKNLYRVVFDINDINKKFISELARYRSKEELEKLNIDGTMEVIFLDFSEFIPSRISQ